MSNLNESSLLAYIAKNVSPVLAGEERPEFRRGSGRRLVAHETLLSRVQELIIPSLNGSLNASKNTAVPLATGFSEGETPRM